MTPCAEVERVARFIRGQLSKEEISRVEHHLDHCDHCLAAVARFASATQSVEDSPGAASSERQDSEFVRLLGAAVRHPRGSAAASWPQRFGPYVVTGLLGRGSMGVVYRAVEEGTATAMAIKTVCSPTPSLLSSLRREIAFLERERHPGVVRVHAHGLRAGEPWYAMELIEGPTLRELIRDLWRSHGRRGRGRGAALERAAEAAGSPPPAAGGRLREVLEVLAALCEPLAFIHRAGIVHCDLKPANVMLQGKRPVLTDFGLLSRAGGAVGRESLEVGGSMRGTVPYIAPELIRGGIPDARADLYAFGCILYECITGQPPFSADTQRQTLHLHLHAPPTPASALVSGLTGELDELLGALLAKRPEERLGDAGVVAQRLTALIDGRRAPPQRPHPYLFRPPLVGRDAILARLREACDGALRGDGQLILVGGESGIGKTFLASELARHAVKVGLEVVTGECAPSVPLERGPAHVIGAALSPFRRLLEVAYDRARCAGEAAVAELFGSELALEQLARYEPVLRRLMGGRSAPEVALPMTSERERVLVALRRLLEGLASDSPLLLVLDDLQWADDLSLAFLASLARAGLAGSPLLVLGMYRTDEARADILAMERMPHVDAVRLEPLDTPAVRALVDGFLAAPAPAPLVEAVAQHAAGNPFFVAEYLRAAMSESLLEQRATGGWGEARPGEAEAPRAWASAVPPTLRALLERRLGAASLPAQRLLEAASVIGRQFALEQLRRVAALEPEPLMSLLDELSARRIVAPASNDGFRFLHDKTREAAYARIAPERRRGLHLAAAEALLATRRLAGDLDDACAEIASHFEHAGASERAAEHFALAGARALRLSAGADAVTYLNEALTLEAGLARRIAPARRAEWETQLGVALQTLGRVRESIAPLGRAAASLGCPMPAGPLRLGVQLLAQLAVQLGHRVAGARGSARRARHSAQALAVGRVFDALHRAFYFCGQGPELMLSNIRSVNALERAAPTPELAVCYASAGATAVLVSAHGVGRSYFRLAMRTLERAPDLASESYVQKLLGLTFLWRGMSREAAAHLERGVALATESQYYRQLDECLAIRAAVEISAGRHASALGWLMSLRQSATRRGDEQMLSWSVMQEAQCAFLRRDTAQAAALLEQAGQHQPALERPDQVWLLALRAYLQLETLDLTAARRSSEQMAEMLGGGPIQSHGLDVFERLAAVRLELWRRSTATPAARDDARAALAACRELVKVARMFRVGMPMALLHLGTFEWLSGRGNKAIRLWSRGLALAATMDVPHDEARLSRALAQALPGRRALLEQRARRLLGALEIPLAQPAEYRS